MTSEGLLIDFSDVTISPPRVQQSNSPTRPRTTKSTLSPPLSHIGNHGNAEAERRQSTGSLLSNRTTDMGGRRQSHDQENEEYATMTNRAGGDIGTIIHQNDVTRLQHLHQSRLIASSANAEAASLVGSACDEEGGVAYKEKENARFLSCGLCSRQVNDAILLKCFHSFCRKCVERHMRKHVIKTDLPCPVCGYVTPVPHGNVETLQDNYIVNQALRQGLQGSTQQTVPIVRCDSCQIQPASVSCSDCAKVYCQPCCEAAHRRKLSILTRRKHALVALEQPTEKQVVSAGQHHIMICSSHDCAASQFCRSCLEAVCDDCAHTHHSPSPPHDCVSLTEGAAMAQSVLAKRHRALITLANVNRRSAKYQQKRRQELFTEKGKVLCALDSRREALTEAISQWYHAACSKVEDHFTTEMADTKTALQRHVEYHVALNSARLCLQYALEYSRGHDLIHLLTYTCQRLDELCSSSDQLTIPSEKSFVLFHVPHEGENKKLTKAFGQVNISRVDIDNDGRVMVPASNNGVTSSTMTTSRVSNVKQRQSHAALSNALPRRVGDEYSKRRIKRWASEGDIPVAVQDKAISNVNGNDCKHSHENGYKNKTNNVVESDDITNLVQLSQEAASLSKNGETKHLMSYDTLTESTRASTMEITATIIQQENEAATTSSSNNLHLCLLPLGSFHTREECEQLRYPSAPGSIALDKTGQFVVIADRAFDRVCVFDANGLVQRVITNVSQPHAAIITSAGDVIVACEGTDRLVVYGPESDDAIKMALACRPMLSPCSLATNHERQFVVYDWQMRWLRIYDSATYDIVVEKPLGESDVGTIPGNIWDALAIGGNGTIFLSSFLGHRIFSFSGGLLKLAFFGNRGPKAPGELQGPCGIATDIFGNLIVTDSKNGRLQVLMQDGRWAVLRLLGDTNITWPIDVDIDDSGRLYVLEQTGEVKIFQYM